MVLIDITHAWDIVRLDTTKNFDDWMWILKLALTMVQEASSSMVRLQH